MIPGFNHNVMHRGKVYHVQTEDSGLQNPQISTHLFLGGNILATRKSSYAELLGQGDVEGLVRERMQEQHKELLRQLIRGAFDGDAEARAYQPGELARGDGATQPAPVQLAPRKAPVDAPAATLPRSPARPAAPALPTVPVVPAPGADRQRLAAPVTPPAAPPARSAPAPAFQLPRPSTRSRAPLDEPPVLPRAGARAAAPPPAPPAPPPARIAIPEIDDEELMSDRRLDEVILAYLAEDLGPRRS